VIGFLACLDHMGLFHPSLIVCNKSLMYQWKEEFVKWWPKFNVSIFHRDVMKRGESEASLINTVLKKGHILIVPYETLRTRQELFVDRDWNYVILDEGHIIRNPFTEITLTIKQFRTPNRILLTGTPIQNRLDELWSLFDFVYPGRLGVFSTHAPIHSFTVLHRIVLVVLTVKWSCFLCCCRHWRHFEMNLRDPFGMEGRQVPTQMKLKWRTNVALFFEN
jgi:hypothetical protein